MKLKTGDGNITIDMYELFMELPREEQLRLAGHLCIEDDIINEVVTLLIDNYSESGSWVGHRSGDCIEKAREKILANLMTLASQALKSAITDRKNAEANQKTYEDWAWKLYHSWPHELSHRRPHGPEHRKTEDYMKAVATQEEIKDALKP
jgi:hypothetical protein